MPDLYRNFNQPGYKIDPLTEIRNAGIVTSGDVYWVSSVSDSRNRTRINDLGRKFVKLTVNAAVAEARDNNNDYIMVIPTDSGTTVPLGTAIDITKDRLHVLGVGAKPAPMGYGGLTFEAYVAANGIDTEMLHVNGAGVEIGGLKFLGTSGTAAGGTMTALVRIGTSASGTPHDLWVHDVHIESTQAAADNGTADLVIVQGNVASGIQGLRFDRCWIGNWNWCPTNGVVNLGVGTAGPKRTEFKDCKFVVDAQATTDKLAVMGTGVTEYTHFENCAFINVEAGTAPASALTGPVLVDNPVILRNCWGVNVTQLGTDTEAYKTPVSSGTQAALFDYGIAVGTAALAPA